MHDILMRSMRRAELGETRIPSTWERGARILRAVGGARTICRPGARRERPGTGLAPRRFMVAKAAFHTSRRSMIDGQLRARGITDHRVLAAMAAVPRELFVPPSEIDAAYDDQPLPIASGQTISQPYIVALMAEAMQLEPGDRVLEIGTGTGYSAAVLSLIAGEVFTIERLPELARSARERLGTLGYARIEVQCSDGSLGWRAHGPYQAIAVTAAGPMIPRSLVEQLDIGGRLVMPVDRHGEQVLVRLTRTDESHCSVAKLRAVRFVPLIGEEGWPDEDQIPCTD